MSMKLVTIPRLELAHALRASLPNSVWECPWEGNSVPQAGVSEGGPPHPPADTPSARNRVSPASAFPNRVWERGWLAGQASISPQRLSLFAHLTLDDAQKEYTDAFPDRKMRCRGFAGAFGDRKVGRRGFAGAFGDREVGRRGFAGALGDQEMGWREFNGALGDREMGRRMSGGASLSAKMVRRVSGRKLFNSLLPTSNP